MTNEIEILLSKPVIINPGELALTLFKVDKPLLNDKVSNQGVMKV